MRVDCSSCMSQCHVDAFIIESVSAEMCVHSPIFVLTVYSTAICSVLHKCLAWWQFKLLFKHLGRNSSNCFSRQTKSLVPPIKPAFGLPQSRSLCMSVQGPGWPSPPEHFCCGFLQAPCIYSLVFIASRQARTQGSHSTAWWASISHTFALLFWGSKPLKKYLVQFHQVLVGTSILYSLFLKNEIWIFCLSVGSSIGRVNARDKDWPPSAITYSIVAGGGTRDYTNFFWISPTTGDVKILGRLDYETTRKHILTVQASDQEKTATASVSKFTLLLPLYLNFSLFFLTRMARHWAKHFGL